MNRDNRLRSAVDGSLLDLIDDLEGFKRVSWSLLLVTSLVSGAVGIVIGRGI